MFTQVRVEKDYQSIKHFSRIFEKISCNNFRLLRSQKDTSSCKELMKALLRGDTQMSNYLRQHIYISLRKEGLRDTFPDNHILMLHTHFFNIRFRILPLYHMYNDILFQIVNYTLLC